eukprot:1001887-Rhodomonas_salina.2
MIVTLQYTFKLAEMYRRKAGMTIMTLGTPDSNRLLRPRAIKRRQPTRFLVHFAHGGCCLGTFDFGITSREHRHQLPHPHPHQHQFQHQHQLQLPHHHDDRSRLMLCGPRQASAPAPRLAQARRRWHRSHVLGPVGAFHLAEKLPAAEGGRCCVAVPVFRCPLLLGAFGGGRAQCAA